MKYKVPRDWEGQTAIILAGGPSLKGFRLSPELKVRTITINDSWRLLPYASVHFFTDTNWWYNTIQKDSFSVHSDPFERVRFHDLIYKGFWISSDEHFSDHPQVRYLKRTGQRGLDINPECLRHGSNSGYAAINLAANYGAKRIILLGYDMKVSGHHTHWHDGHPGQTAASFADTIQKSFLPHFESLVEPLKDIGVEVINCTPDSALEIFPKMTLDEALALPMPEVGSQYDVVK